jgi:phasin family protein
LICINPQWLAATNSRRHSTNPRENIMSKDSKPTKKKATVSEDSKLMKNTVSDDSKPAVKTAASDDSKPTEKTIVSNDSKPTEKSAVSDDSKPAVKTAASSDSKPADKNAVSDDSKPTEETTVVNDGKPTEKATVSNDVKPTEKGTTGETPFFDFTKLMSQFRLPGVDFAALVDRERKNIEALAKANRIAFEGWQRLVRRQAEMLQETMKKVVADASQEDAKKKRADLAKEGFEKALANMRELAEITTQSQKEAFDVIRKRIEENVEGIRNFGKRAGK